MARNIQTQEVLRDLIEKPVRTALTAHNLGILDAANSKVWLSILITPQRLNAVAELLEPISPQQPNATTVDDLHRTAAMLRAAFLGDPKKTSVINSLDYAISRQHQLGDSAATIDILNRTRHSVESTTRFGNRDEIKDLLLTGVLTCEQHLRQLAASNQTATTPKFDLTNNVKTDVLSAKDTIGQIWLKAMAAEPKMTGGTDKIVVSEAIRHVAKTVDTQSFGLS